MPLANTDHQFQQQFCYKKAVNHSFNPVNFVFSLVALIILGTSSSIIFNYVLSSISSISSSSVTNPTSLPWISDKSDCEYRGRIWRDDQCWDYEHNPMF